MSKLIILPGIFLVTFIQGCVIDKDKVARGDGQKVYGRSVRCMKD